MDVKVRDKLHLSLNPYAAVKTGVSFNMAEGKRQHRLLITGLDRLQTFTWDLAAQPPMAIAKPFDFLPILVFNKFRSRQSNTIPEMETL